MARFIRTNLLPSPTATVPPPREYQIPSGTVFVGEFLTIDPGNPPYQIIPWGGTERTHALVVANGDGWAIEIDNAAPIGAIFELSAYNHGPALVVFSGGAIYGSGSNIVFASPASLFAAFRKVDENLWARIA